MNDEAKKADLNSRSSYEKFLLAEYDNIAKAHFNTVNSVSTFFRYYLLIVALPFPVVALLFRSSDPNTLRMFAAEFKLAVPIFTTVIAFVGICVMGYTAHLRTSATIYARTVNGIRDYFTRRSGLSEEEEAKIKVLPRTTERPTYREWFSFGFVVVTFILIDLSYCGAGWWWWLVETDREGTRSIIFLYIGLALLLLLHILTYECIVRRREKQYQGGR